MTHRQIDARLHYPQGTTSYYARTRAELINGALEVLVEHFDEATTQIPVVTLSTDDEAIAFVTAAIEALVAQPHDQIARFVLAIDMRQDDEVRDALGPSSPAQTHVNDAVRGILEHFGVQDPATHTAGILALADGLVFARLVTGSPVDVEASVRAYWTGLPRA